MDAGWLRVTALGDSAVLLPMAAVLALWLLFATPTRRLGVRWVLLLGGCIAGVAVSKLAYMGWGLHPPGLNFTGLSGHAALSTLVWPAVAGMLAARAGPRLRAAALAAGAALALAITISRPQVDAHSVSETVLGALWGLPFAVGFLWRQPRPLPVQALAGWAALGLAVPLLLGYGRVLPSNRILAVVALKLSGHHRIYNRCDLPRRLRGDLCRLAPPARAHSRKPNAGH